MKLKGSITLIKFLLPLFLLFSCSHYINYIEKKQELELVKTKQAPLWCKSTPKINIIHDDLNTLEEVNKILPSYDIPITDLGILLSLYQTIVRPDATDWNSRVQLHYKMGKEEFHMDFGPQYKLPFFNALLSLEKKGGTKFTLNYWRRYLNSSLPKRIKLQKKLNEFISLNEAEFLALKSINKRFFRLNKPLQPNETFYRPSILFPKRPQYSQPQPYSYPIEKKEENFQCSFDSGLYQKGIFLISHNKDSENSFGVIKDNGDYFYAVTKKIYKGFKDSNRQSLFPGQTAQSLNPYCTFKTDLGSVLLMSYNSRDSGQLLYHLYNYGVKEAKSPQDLYSFISYPRHQFLLRPGRLLYESERGNKGQLRYFLSLDFPVYHVKNLGTILGLWSEKKQTTFISDPRVKTNQSCLLPKKL
jgi:hypothetical protein